MSLQVNMNFNEKRQCVIFVGQLVVTDVLKERRYNCIRIDSICIHFPVLYQSIWPAIDYSRQWSRVNGSHYAPFHIIDISRSSITRYFTRKITRSCGRRPQGLEDSSRDRGSSWLRAHCVPPNATRDQIGYEQCRLIGNPIFEMLQSPQRAFLYWWDGIFGLWLSCTGCLHLPCAWYD